MRSSICEPQLLNVYKFLPTTSLTWRSVNTSTIILDFRFLNEPSQKVPTSIMGCVLNASDSICFWVWVWMAEWLVYSWITIPLFRNFHAFFIKNGQIEIWPDISKTKIIIFLNVNGGMVIRITCVGPNGNSAVYTQTQTERETEGYRMHHDRLRDKASWDTGMTDRFTLIAELNFSVGRFYFTGVSARKCVSLW